METEAPTTATHELAAPPAASASTPTGSAPAPPPPPSKVGFAYDASMLLHCHKGARQQHPERPERLTVALDQLGATGLLGRCERLPERFATDEELLRVHTPKHLAHVAACAEAVQSCPGDGALHEPQGDGAIYYNGSTERAARAAAGCVLAAADAVIRHQVQSAFALVRPPGHHAEAEHAMGFCFYNSVRLSRIKLGAPLSVASDGLLGASAVGGGAGAPAAAARAGLASRRPLALAPLTSPPRDGRWPSPPPPRSRLRRATASRSSIG
eukprot:6853753-Prymnesium_polylepis.1